MICPRCMIQMHQKQDEKDTDHKTAHDGIGGGSAEENRYITWELKECGQCGRKTVEYYAALMVPDADNAKMIAKAISTLIESHYPEINI